MELNWWTELLLSLLLCYGGWIYVYFRNVSGYASAFPEDHFINTKEQHSAYWKKRANYVIGSIIITTLLFLLNIFGGISELLVAVAGLFKQQIEVPSISKLPMAFLIGTNTEFFTNLFVRNKKDKQPQI